MVPDPHFQSTESSYPQNHGSILKPTRRDTTTDHLGGRRHGESIGAMSKRVDFSLGMSSISSGDQYGDVFDDPVKPRLPQTPQVRMTSPSPSRGSQDDKHSLAQTTSRDSGSKSHRNRFFSRSKSRMDNEHNGDDGVNLEDLEEGRSGRKFSVYDMPNIPEASGANSTPVVGVTPPSMAHMGRIDPRTGIESSQAVTRDSALERGDLPSSIPARRPEMR